MQVLHRIGLTGLVLSMMVAGCAGPRAVDPSGSPQSPVLGSQSSAKRIVTAIRGNPPSMARAKTNPSGMVASVPGLDALEELIHAGLTHPNNQGVVLPQLAEAAPTIENGLWQVLPDGRMETTWKIRPNAQWHDGTPVTTTDLVFTTTVEQDRELPIPRNPVYDLIEGIETVDAATVVVRWKQPFIEADSMFSYSAAVPMPRHLLEKTYLEDKAALLALPYWTQEYVGAGPFKIRDWVMDSHVVLEANPHYVLGRPRIDEIEVKFIADPTTLMANVLAGVELTIGRALSLEQGLQIKEQWKDGDFHLRSRSWTPINVQFVNTNPPIVRDLRFRRAMLHAIDRQQLVDSIMGGLTSIAHSFVSPDTPEGKAVGGSLVRYEFDSRRSVQMIEELGYRRAPDGMFADPAGQRLALELWTTVQNPIHPSTTAAVANYWQQIGVTVEQNHISPQRAQDREYRAQFPAFELVQTGNGLNSKDVRRFHSASISLPENRFQASGNNSRYSHPDVDAAIDRYVSTIPKPERMQALAQIVQHQTENLTIMGLMYSTEPTMVANRILNVTTRSDRATEAWNAHEWDVR